MIINDNQSIVINHIVLRIAKTCADPASFVRRGPTLTTLFFLVGGGGGGDIKVSSSARQQNAI